MIKLFESINTSLIQSTSGNIPLDYEQLKTNEEYKSILRTNIGNRSKTLIWIRMSLNLMEELDKRLQMELKR